MSGHRWRAAWDYPMESGLVVVVPEAEGPVGPVRGAFDPYAKIGVPPHITVLFPFLMPSGITSETLRNVADAVRDVLPFSFELISVESFDDSIIYLAPSPAEPFVELTNKLWSAFPEFPPFGGRFDSVIPHVSVGGVDFGATKETVTEQLAGALPIGAAARQVTLLVEDQDGWTSGGQCRWEDEGPGPQPGSAKRPRPRALNPSSQIEQLDSKRYLDGCGVVRWRFVVVADRTEPEAYRLEAKSERAHTPAMVLRRQDKRGLTTLLFTDIVGSSGVAVELGDRRWRQLQARHHAEVRKQLRHYGGREVDTAGDGFFATFGSPAAGVRCAFAIVREMRELGLDIRAGLHIGEAELAGEKVGGIAVTTAQRVESAAEPGQVLATDTIVHLVAGSGLEFTDLGSRELKGVPGKWELFALAAVDGQPVGTPLDPKDAAEARDRSSPLEAPKGSPRRALALGLVGVLVVVVAGAVLFHRDRPGSTGTSQTSPPLSAALVAFNEGSGDQAFRVTIPGPRAPGSIAGPIVLTGRLDSPTAFAWVQYGTGQAWSGLEINRTIGEIVDQFPTQGHGSSPECVCLASAEDRIWYPVSNGKLVAVGLNEYRGTTLRGIDIKGGREKNILVKKALDPAGVAALVSGGGYLWVGDTTTDQVYRIDPGTEEVRPFSLRQSADVLTFADGSLWVLDTLEGKITRVDPKKGHFLHSYAIAGDLQSMAVGGGYVWVTDASGDDIQRIPEDLASPSTVIPVGQVGGPPRAVAYDDGAIVVGFTGGTIAKIDPSNPSSPALIWAKQAGVVVSSITIDRGTVLAAGGVLGLVLP